MGGSCITEVWPVVSLAKESRWEAKELSLEVTVAFVEISSVEKGRLACVLVADVVLSEGRVSNFGSSSRALAGDSMVLGCVELRVCMESPDDPGPPLVSSFSPTSLGSSL
jgi:hypothetical protein